MPDIDLPIPINEEMRALKKVYKGRSFRQVPKERGTRGKGTAGHPVPQTASSKGPPPTSQLPSPLRTEEHVSPKLTPEGATKESVPTGAEDPTAVEMDAEEVIEGELVIEDFTIDGICGVY
jgi:mycofactocin precursor